MKSFLISMGLRVLLELVKTKIPADGSSKKMWKKDLAELFREIGKAYKDDAEFQDLTR